MKRNSKRNRRPIPCDVQWCDEPVLCSGLCVTHYHQIRRYGEIRPIEDEGSRLDKPTKSLEDELEREEQLYAQTVGRVSRMRRWIFIREIKAEIAERDKGESRDGN